MKQSTDRIITTHSGSLPRLESLRELMVSKGEGQAIDEVTWRDAVRQSVKSVIKNQVDAGISVINDGENSKVSFWGYITERLSGFEPLETTPVTHHGLYGAQREVRDFPEFFANRPNMDAFARAGRGWNRNVVCTSPVEWRDFDSVGTDISNVKHALEGLEVDEVFLSSTSPGNVLQKAPNHYYPDDEAYLQAVSDVMKREYEAIIDAGFVLQLDCPDLASRSGPEGYAIEDFRRDIERNVEALNYATKDLPAEMMRIHVCWGSDERPHHLDLELKDIADILLKARPAGITIVAANGRHEHEWRVWEGIKVPDDKVIIPGVVDSTTNIIEHPQTVAERICRFANVLGREKVIAGVDCGFQTQVGRDLVDPRVAWAKMRSLAEGARLATEQLWPRESSALRSTS